MPLADTPVGWNSGPSVSTLHVLSIFVGIPLLVILTVSLLVYAPSWMHGPRYRPGQPWASKSEWFGTSVAADPSGGVVLTADAEGAEAAEPGPEAAGSSEGADDGRPGATAMAPSGPVPHTERESGGASATW